MGHPWRGLAISRRVVLAAATSAVLLLQGCSPAPADPVSPVPAQTTPADGGAGSEIWRPTVNGRWQYQLQPRRAFADTGGIDVDICAVPWSGGDCVRPDVFDIDLYDLDGVTPNTKAVEAIHERGAHAICYIDAGSIETFRPDYPRFVRFHRRCEGCLIGEPFSRIFNDENWANLSNRQGQRDFMLRMMAARVRSCVEAGFDAVEFDVVDAYAAGRRATGWNITPGMQLTYNRALAQIAHRRGLSVGLKNDLGQIEELLSSFDFAINEQCFQYDECGELQAFIEAGKPVFQVEYRLAPEEFCHEADALQFRSIIKAHDFSLFARPYVPCR